MTRSELERIASLETDNTRNMKALTDIDKKMDRIIVDLAKYKGAVKLANLLLSFFAAVIGAAATIFFGK